MHIQPSFLRATECGSHAKDHLCQICKKSIQSCTCCIMDKIKCAIFKQFHYKVMVEDTCQDQRPLHMTHPLMPVIICIKYENNPSRKVQAVEWTGQDMPYFSSFIANSWLNDPEDIGQGQKSLCATHTLMMVIICGKYGKNPTRTEYAVEQTPQDVRYFSSFIAKSWLTDLEDIGQGQRSLHTAQALIPVVIFAQYGRKSIQNCRQYRMATRD